jgi:hypothetical protein
MFTQNFPYTTANIVKFVATRTPVAETLTI